jgi:hypothetical protein
MDMHPEWASCEPISNGGLWDPPITLHPGVMLVPTTADTAPTFSSPAVSRPTLAIPASTTLMKIPTATVAPEAPPSTGTEVMGPSATTVLPPAPPAPPAPPVPLAPLAPLAPPRESQIDQINDGSPGIQTLRLPSTVQTNNDRPLDIIWSPDQGDHAISPPQAAVPVLSMNGKLITADAASRFTIGTQMLAPGSVISIGNTRLSMDSEASQVVVDGTSTITLERFAQASARIDTDQKPTNAGILLVHGGTTRTLPNSLVTAIDATTTIIALSPAPVVRTQPYTTIVGGVTTTLANGQVNVIGGTPTVVSVHQSNIKPGITLTVGGVTLKLPGRVPTVIGGTPVFFPITAMPDTRSLTVVYGGRTETLSDGKITVFGGTTTVVLAPTVSGGNEAPARTPASVSGARPLFDHASVGFDIDPTEREEWRGGQPGNSAQATGLSGSSSLRTGWIGISLVMLFNFIALLA